MGDTCKYSVIDSVLVVIIIFMIAVGSCSGDEHKKINERLERIEAALNIQEK